MRLLLPLLRIRLLLTLLLVSLVAPAVGFGSSQESPPPTLFCEHPRSLRLYRFEDRSARLECGGHAIVRISVPG